MFYYPRLKLWGLKLIACWVIFQAFVLSAFFRLNCSINSTKQSVSNSRDADQPQHFVRSDMDPNCLQRLSAYDKRSHQQVKSMHNHPPLEVSKFQATSMECKYFCCFFTHKGPPTICSRRQFQILLLFQK